MKNKFLLSLSAGHAFTDMSQGALPVLLPFIIAAGGLSYAQAAGLTFAIALASSMSQPVFGIMSDRISMKWLMPVGVLLSGCALSLIGFFPTHYWVMFAIAITSGIGVAAFHPEGARMANRLAGKKKGGSMSTFSVGGTVGMAIGPIIATSAMINLGLRGSAVLAIPAISMCILLFYISPKIHRFADTQEAELGIAKKEQKNEWRKFLWLSIAIASRSIINHSLITFLPLYWLNVLNQSKAASGMIVSYMVFIGALINFSSGHLADRFGINKVIRVGWILLIPSIFFLTHITNPFFAMLMLIPISLGVYSLVTPLIVLGQQYLPKNVGFASGITMGLGVSIGGLVAPLLGTYADIHGLAAAFKLLSILPVFGIIVALTAKPPSSMTWKS